MRSEPKPGWPKGPWLHQDRPGWTNLVIAPGRGRIVDLSLGRTVGTDEEKRAIARLIAAAPAMAEYVRRRADAGDEEAAAVWETINGRQILGQITTCAHRRGPR